MHKEPDKDTYYIKQMVTKKDPEGGFVRGAHLRKRKEHEQRHKDEK